MAYSFDYKSSKNEYLCLLLTKKWNWWSWMVILQCSFCIWNVFDLQFSEFSMQLTAKAHSNCATRMKKSKRINLSVIVFSVLFIYLRLKECLYIWNVFEIFICWTAVQFTLHSKIIFLLRRISLLLGPHLYELSFTAYNA